MSLIQKWAPILEHADMPEIKDPHRLLGVVRDGLLEQQALREVLLIVPEKT